MIHVMEIESQCQRQNANQYLRFCGAGVLASVFFRSFLSDSNVQPELRTIAFVYGNYHYGSVRILPFVLLIYLYLNLFNKYLFIKI